MNCFVWITTVAFIGSMGCQSAPSQEKVENPLLAETTSPKRETAQALDLGSVLLEDITVGPVSLDREYLRQLPPNEKDEHTEWPKSARGAMNGFWLNASGKLFREQMRALHEYPGLERDDLGDFFIYLSKFPPAVKVSPAHYPGTYIRYPKFTSHKGEDGVGPVRIVRISPIVKPQPVPTPIPTPQEPTPSPSPTVDPSNKPESDSNSNARPSPPTAPQMPAADPTATPNAEMSAETPSPSPSSVVMPMAIPKAEQTPTPTPSPSAPSQTPAPLPSTSDSAPVPTPKMRRAPHGTMESLIPTQMRPRDPNDRSPYPSPTPYAGVRSLEICGLNITFVDFAGSKVSFQLDLPPSKYMGFSLRQELRHLIRVIHNLQGDPETQ